MFAARILNYPRGHRLKAHSHDEAQLLYAVTGVMEVETAAGRWVVPPQRAVWLPAGAAHAVEMRSEVDMRTLYLVPGWDAAQPAGEAMRLAELSRPVVLTVGPLMREAIVELVRLGGTAEEGRAGRLLAVLRDEIARAPDLPLHLPMPADRRARRVAEALRRDPGDARSLEAWATSCGASRRTLMRLFQRETGLSFGAWRQQARLLAGLAVLAEGGSVTAAASSSGYATASAFSAMFRRALGVPPGTFFAHPGDGPAAPDA